MRLSILTLFIALPAATYAAVTTRQLACTQLGESCLIFPTCCADSTCVDGLCI
ncbi:hypothetical protein BJV77DRAFT_212658 [Russula vinacea]|nr:hypothetical protein BJV77DRAFT_212658 [Russula vinacea]